MGNPILSEQQTALVNEEKAILGRLLEMIRRFDPAPPDEGLIRQTIDNLEELFLFVVVGEFNSGKSTFINALLGEKVMEEGVTPTTSMINRLRYGPARGDSRSSNGLIERTYPADFLRDIAVVDTPGTNAILRQHEALTETFVPRSDLVLFITSSDRPFTESERALLEKIRNWGKKIILILNKIDLLENPDDVQRVRVFIEDNARILLGITPPIFPVSARLAQRYRPKAGNADTALWQASGFPALEQFIFSTLDEAGRVRLKLLNPLGVAERVARQYTTQATERLGMLREDLSTIDHMARQLEIYKQDMESSFSYRLSQIDSIIYETRDRGDAFFERNVRIGNVWDLIRAERFRKAFEQEVVADLSARVDTAVQALTDWMVSQELKLWQDINEYISRRRRTVEQEHEMGAGRTAFDYNRGELLQSVGTAARDAVRNYDQSAEAQQLAISMHEAIAQMGIAAGGALIGGAIAATTTIAALDVTGLAALGLGSVLAIVILPHRKRKVQADFRKKMEQLRQRLSRAMTDQFQAELTRSMERMDQAVAPYTRFIRAEHTKGVDMLNDLNGVQEELANLRSRIG